MWAGWPVLLALGCTGAVTGGLPGEDPATPGGPGPGMPGGSVAPGAAPGTPGSPSGPIASVPGPSTRFARLTHQQWENTVRDLLRLSAPAGLSSSFVAEPLRSSFDTNGGILAVSPDLWSDYQSAAETLARQVARDPKRLAAISPNADPRAFIDGFGRRAFRRPLTDAEVTRYRALFDKGAALIASGDAFADGVELSVSAFLQSPHFLYRSETSAAVVGGKVPLNDFEIASRLSYGLTNTMPDDALLAAAGEGRLVKREGLLAETRRLLDSPAAERTVSDFHDQLLRMREWEAVKKDTKLTPLFPAGIGADLKQEALAFIKDVVGNQKRGLVELLTAPYTFANARVAKLYGLPAPPAGAGFARIDLDRGQRAGLLTQIGFLASNAEGDTPNIIIRGVRLASDVLCVSLPAPPDAIPMLPAIAPNSTNRQRVEQLTRAAPCSGCHATAINPLGYAFETLDGLGRFRTQENGRPIDASGTYALDGADVPFDGAVSLIEAMARSQQAHDCYARRWAEYLYGRDLDAGNDADRNLISQAGTRSRADLPVKELILQLIATDAFTSRLP
jgi:hypothetical protein